MLAVVPGHGGLWYRVYVAWYRVVVGTGIWVPGGGTGWGGSGYHTRPWIRMPGNPLGRPPPQPPWSQVGPDPCILAVGSQPGCMDPGILAVVLQPGCPDPAILAVVTEMTTFRAKNGDFSEFFVPDADLPEGSVRNVKKNDPKRPRFGSFSVQKVTIWSFSKK